MLADMNVRQTEYPGLHGYCPYECSVGMLNWKAEIVMCDTTTLRGWALDFRYRLRDALVRRAWLKQQEIGH